MTFDSVDTIAGNPTRYAAKILGQPPIRRMTVYTLLNLCAAVGLRLTLTRDDHRLAQLRRRSQWAEPDVSTLVGNPFFRLKKTGPDAAGQENFCAAEIFDLHCQYSAAPGRLLHTLRLSALRRDRPRYYFRSHHEARTHDAANIGAVPPQLRARIEARAAAGDRSLAYEARQLLERGLQQSEEAAA